MTSPEQKPVSEERIADPGSNDPFSVAARRISCLASNGRGITFDEAYAYVLAECSRLKEQNAAWKTGIPDVSEGRQEIFWCALKNDNGKIHYRPLNYCHRYIMPLSDSCDDAPEGCEPVSEGDDDYYWTGWYEQSCEQCETQWTVSAQIIAWMRLPRNFTP
jgi:hypothetical protein